MKKVILLLTTCFVGYALFHVAFTLKKTQKPIEHTEQNQAPQNQWEHTQQWCLKELKSIEKAIWKKLTTLGITKQTTEALKARDYTVFLKNTEQPYHEPVSETLKAEVAALCLEFGINPENITLINWDKTYAATSDDILYINEKTFKTLSADTQKFILAHELQHSIFKDHSTRYMIHQQLADNDSKFDANNLDYNHPLLEYRRFTELRADIMVALKSKEWAELYNQFTQEIWNITHGDAHTPSHPKTSERVQVAQNIVQQQHKHIII